MMTDMMMQINISWTERNNLEFHIFKSIYQSIADSLKKSVQGIDKK